MNYNSCQYLDEYLPSMDTPSIPKKSYPSLYQHTQLSSTSPSLSLSSSPSLSSSSAQEIQSLQQRRVEHNTTLHPISNMLAIDPFYCANRTNSSYYPPLPPVTGNRVDIRNTTANMDYTNHTYYFVSTHKSIIQQCSDTFFLLTGYSPLELIGKSLADFLHPDDLYHFNGHHISAIFPLIRFYKKNGQTLPLECKKVTNFTQEEVIYIGMTNNTTTSEKPPTAFRPDINVSSEFKYPTSCCMNSSGSATSATPRNNFYKNHRDMLLRNYVCVDCGTTASPEWRRGPHGPKTLCNACGLRWAKKNKRK